MDTESINSLLKYFPYTEAEKNLVRELLIKRDPSLMSALSDFLQTKDVTALNQKFKNIISFQKIDRPYDQSLSYDYKQGASNVSTGQVLYTSPNVSTKNYEASTTTLYSSPSGISKTLETSAYGGGASNGGQTTIYASTIGTSKVVSYQENVKIDDGRPKKELTESVKRAKVETMENIQKLKRMSEYAKNKEIEDTSNPQENVLKGFTFDFLPEKIKNNYLDAEGKKKLIEMASHLSFENFLDIRHFLRLDKIDLAAFVDKAKARIEELHPLKPGQDIAAYNPGFSLEEFIALLCGDSEIPKSKMGYMGLLFFYLDYNHNQILETDEILQGFIMLGPGDKKDKITAAFQSLGGKSFCLSETELSHYMEIVIRVYKLREDMGSADKADLYDIQKAIDLAAKSLARRIFETVDYDESGTISLEEFLIWHDRIEAKANLFELKNDVSFKKSLDLAKESKKKRLDALLYSTDVQTQTSTKEKFKNDILDNSLHTKTLDALKKTLKVDKVDVGTAVKVFKAMSYSKALTTKEFAIFWEKVFDAERVKFTAEEEANVNKEIVRLFQILDTNKNGVLEWDELMSALIFVLRGSESEKARIAFEQFDSNGDGTLQFKELFFFLKGIFNLLMYDNQHELFKKETPDTIAFATAKECFAQFKLDVEKDSIDYKTFQKWYSSNM